MKLINHFILTFLLSSFIYASDTKKIIYLNPDNSILFWQIMAKGIKASVEKNNYTFEIYDSQNSAKKELELSVKAINEKVAGIIVSPSNSSACVTILKLAKRASIPVVISDIGTDNGEYVSYISSNNFEGAYNLGKTLTDEMIKKDWQNGKVGIIAIPQKRLNGQQRTAGFMKALKESNIKGADIKQMAVWTQEETYNFTKEFINEYPDLRALWIQTSNSYNSAIKAIKDMGKEKELILIAFDAEPEFLELIPEGKILASGMQQPYLMGQNAALAMIQHLKGKKVSKSIQVPILTVSTTNVKKKLEDINLNVLGKE